MNTTKKYDWNQIQLEYDAGANQRALQAKYGISFGTFSKAAKRGDFRARNNSEAKVLHHTLHPMRHTTETKEKLSIIRSLSLNENAFYSKRSWYKGIKLDSSYELSLAIYLDLNNISWIRPKALRYNDNGQIRRYLPDFYLPDYDIYLDPKNDYLIKKDARKISLVESFNAVRVLVLDSKSLTWNSIATILGVGVGTQGGLINLSAPD